MIEKCLSLYVRELFVKSESKLVLLVLTVESASVKWRLRHFKNRDTAYHLEWMGT